MLTVPQALEAVLALMAPVGVETVPLARAAGRVLAAPVAATRDQPPFDASAMDGYAVRAADAAPGARLRLVGAARAGEGWAGAVGPGEAARIFTGAPVPPGADAILPQEDARAGDGAVVPTERPAVGAWIRPRGLDFAAGAALDAPRRLSPADLMLAAAMNAPMLTVRRRPVVAIIPTGDELVEPGETPGPDQIVASSGVGVAALLTAFGAEAIVGPIARDRPEAVRAALERAAGADLIVTLGGASVGDHDLVARAVGALAFHNVAMRPGKPLMAGRFCGAPLLGLPGNPVSTLVCAHVFLRPALDALLGLPAGPLARHMLPLAVDLPAGGPREHYMRARLVDDGAAVEPFATQDSSVQSRLSAADVLAVHPAHGPAMARGTPIGVIPLR